jgi:hypothetical protein
MMAIDDAARIREACGSLGQLEAFAIGGPARTILVVCVEIRGCYSVNLWCDAPELANEIEAFLTTRSITSYRTWEHFSGGISLGYTVNEVLDAASTVMKIAGILKMPPKPGRARQLIQINSWANSGGRQQETNTRKY